MTPLKMMPRRLAITLCLLTGGTALYAQESELAQHLAAHAYAIERQAGSFAGPGVDKLLEEAQRSQFVLFGERHFTHEMPLFIEAMLPPLTTLGFGALAVETGPVAAASFVRKSSAEEPLPERAYDFPFYVTVEEIRLLETFLAQVSAPDPLWGIDQEGLFGYRTALAEIEEQAETPAQISLVHDLQEKADSAFQAFMASGRYGNLLYFSRADSVVSRLRTAFDGHEEALEMIEHLSQAEAIHRSRDGFFKNTERLRVMKQNFLRNYLRAYTATGQHPRVVVKMGSNHTQRGLNDQLLPDMGGFLEDLAAATGSHSLHVGLYQLRGRTVFFTPENAQADRLTPRAEPFVYTYPPVLTEVAPADAWMLYDLRPLRELIWRQRWVTEADRLAWVAGLPQDFQTLVGSHDLVIMVPETSPQTLAPID